VLRKPSCLNAFRRFSQVKCGVMQPRSTVTLSSYDWVSLPMTSQCSGRRSAGKACVPVARAPVLALLLMPLVLTAACNDPTGFGPTLSTYVARTVNGALVPAPLLQNANYELLVVADTLRFGLLGQAQWTQVRRTTVAGVAREVEVGRANYTYHLHGDSVRFSFACPPDADCAPPPHGVFSGDRRELTVQLPLSEALIVYERTSL
jgi:hypothetical protein